MTLDTALELDHDGVRLLRLAGGRRTELGALQLDDPDFDTRIAALRNGICGEDTDVEVVLPPSLVLFLEVGEAGDAEIEARLEEETPCALDDLVVGRNGDIAAAVERATLEEARDFAREHGFRPAAFAARPGNGTDGAISFRYEPLPPPTFRRHRETADEPDAPTPADDGAAAALTDQHASANIQHASANIAAPTAAPGEPETDTLPAEASNRAPDDPFMTAAADGAATGESTEEPAPAADATEADVAVPWRTTRRNDAVASDEVPGLFTATSAPDAPEPGGTQIPAISFRTATAQTPPPEPDDQGTSAEPAEEPDVPVTFRHGGFDPDPQIEDASEPAPMAEPELPAENPPRQRQQEPDTGRAPAPTVPMPGRRAPAAVPSLATPRVEPAKTEADALTVFGARGEPAPKARGFTMLHAAAALLAAGVVFAAYELFEGDMAELDIVNLEKIATGAIDPLTGAGGESAGAVDPGAPASPDEPGSELAALDPAVSVNPVPRPDEPPPETVVDAPRSELATPVALPDSIELETPALLDAPVLPPQPGEAAPGAFTPPPPPGTVFEMDERGLVRPTEDGAMTPQGVMVHSGQPVTLPPAEALVAPENPTPPDEEVAETQGDAALAPTAEAPVPDGPPATAQDIPRIRPPVRPEDAVAAPVVTALAAGEDTPRPRARPAAPAVATSSDADPDFDALAREAQTQTAAAGAGVAAAAPRAAEPPPPEPEGRPNVSVQPSAPTRGSVADRATVQNALRLSRVNLIGVYGTASDRRALIRLPTGRYIKVKVGDRVDGGRVASIQNSRVEYVKGGRRYDLSLPSG